MYSILELPLVVEPWQADAIDKKMECSRRIYNSMLSKNLKKYNEMTKTREWKELNRVIKEELQLSPKKKTQKLKDAYDRKNVIMRENGFSDFDFRSQSIVFSKYYQKHISSVMASIGIGKSMWVAFEKLFFGNGEKVSFKKFDAPISLASDNKSGIRFLKLEDGYYIRFSNTMAKSKKITIKVKGPNTEYDSAMLDSNIKIVRVVKRIEKGRRHYYCQLTVDKKPYIKLDADGNPKHSIGEGDVGIAIWRGHLCAVSKDRIFRCDISPDADEFSKKREELTRELEHLRRVNNPDNFNEDGTVKKGIIGENGKRQRLCWNESNHYKKVKAELKELYRKHDVAKKLLHNKIVWELLSMGDTFHFADTSFLTMKPEWDEENPLPNSEYRKKKQRRRSIQETAPATLLTKLDMKLKSFNLEPINRYELPEALYWYRHDKGVSDKDLFAGSIINIEGTTLSQTLYRAYLIRHYDKAGYYDQKALTEEWESFVKNKETTPKK